MSVFRVQPGYTGSRLAVSRSGSKVRLNLNRLGVKSALVLIVFFYMPALAWGSGENAKERSETQSSPRRRRRRRRRRPVGDGPDITRLRRYEQNARPRIAIPMSNESYD